MAALDDLAAQKLIAIIYNREKRDFIDLYFLFQKVSAENVLQNFSKYEPITSPKSFLYPLTESETVEKNKSEMPKMRIDFSWEEMRALFFMAARHYINRVGDAY